jgi:hypothetical protein
MEVRPVAVRASLRASARHSQAVPSPLRRQTEGIRKKRQIPLLERDLA